MRIGFLLTINLILLWAISAWSASVSLPVHLSASRIEYDKNTNTYQAWGHVVITQGKRNIVADYVKVDMKTQEAFLKGHIVFKADGDWLKAEKAEIDLKTYQGILYHAYGFFGKNHFYVRGQRVKKTGKDTYEIEKAEITTCDGQSPAWHFTAHHIKVQLEGWASATHLTFWVKSIPLAYTPYFTLPVRTKRQTGFLLPMVGFSERDGTDVTLPFFWNLGPNKDITLYQRYLTKRGYMQGLELRYALNPDDIGIFYFDYLNDHFDDPKYPEIMRLDRRWWLRGKMNHLLPGDVKLRLDLDLVSDQYYLKEFTEGFDNYEHCNQTFLRYFHRGFDTDRDALERHSSLSLTKNWVNYSLIGELDYNQNLDKSSDEYTLQRLPQLTFIRNNSPILNSGLFLKWQAIFTNFWRLKDTTGRRLHFEPTLSYPLHFKYFKLLPAFSPIETAYFTSKGNYLRFTYEPSLEMKTDLWRYFNWPFTFVHHLEPRIVYKYRPDVDQDNLPYFDSLDRLSKENLLTYSLTNYFLTSGQGNLKEVARLEISQSYDFNEARRKVLPGEKRRPFSNVLVEAQVQPTSNFYLDAETEISPYGEGIRKFQSTLNYHNRRGDYLNLDYEYAPETARDLKIDSLLNLIYHWSIKLYNQHSFLYHQNIETRVGLHYQAQCWGVEFAYSDLYNDHKFMIIFSLTGIGQVKGFSFGG